ncbi:centrosomal protein of 104 kDa [Culicoides brevitarsis]|uniref:centrosomal protein of 104 kDa n=1 Tax=Culicoides brevitarsis TaxID=469753 RepID=UPI00307CC113
MVKKIPFKVIFASDEQTDFPASELNTHGPTVQGWRSNPENNTPKEILLKLDHPARISKIQVLAHQYLIPERIELWIHYSPQKCAPCTPSSQSFEYMGFVALSDNANSNYQSRELQSVSVEPKIGTHLKLRIGPSYENPQNPQRQAALLAVNVLGEEVMPCDGDLNQLVSKPAEATYDSICDDLSFCMYVEESVAEVVRQMEMLKHKAVQDERFEYARKLKLCMTSLRSAGERLGRYALAKRQAVQLEDFNAACLRKEQIEMYRNSVFELLQVDKLLEKDGLNPDNDVCSELYTSKPVLPSAPSLQDVANVLMKNVIQIPFDPPEPLDLNSESSFDHTATSTTGHQRKSSLSSLKSHSDAPGSPLFNGITRSPKTASPTPSSTGSIRRRNKSLPRNTYDDYDEREIPTLRHSQTNEYLKECYAPSPTNQGEDSKLRGRSKLNDRERRQASLPILVFGNEFIEMFYSRQFQDREEGLTRLRNILKGESVEVCTGGPNKIARAATFLLHRCVRDVVFSVFATATETIRTLFMDFVPNRVSVSEVSRLTDKLLPELLTKTGDPSPRVHNLAQHTILTIADCPQVREQQLVTPALARTISSGTHPRLALSRLQMLEQLVLSQGLTREKSSLTLQFIEAAISGIHHPAEHVRKVAERILLLIYKHQPRLVRKQLPPDDDITRRNLLYRQLFSEFDKIDSERRKEMTESKMMDKSYLSIGTFSPPLSGSSRSSPPVDVKFKARHENRNTVSFAGYKTPTNDINAIDAKLLKSKSGNAIDKLNQFLKDVETHSKQNGAVGGTMEREKREFVSRIPQSKTRHSSRNKESHQNGNGSEACTPAEHQIICTFCDWTCNDPAALDRHYWKTCPILTKCPQCSLILEIAALNSHLINECDAKESYLPCERCYESVHKDLYEYHLMEDYCIEVTNGADRCPLCHDEIFLPMEGGWRRHLLGKSGCRGNPRTKSKL